MLTHEQLDALRDVAGELIGPINDYLLSEIARRISEAGQLTSTAAYEIWRMQNLGVSQREIKKRLRALLQVSHRELRRLLTQAADVGYSFDLKNLPFVQAVPFEANGSLQQMLRAAVKLAQEDLTNLVQTIGFVAPDGKTYPLTKAYKKACDFAFTQTFTGATDYNTAIRQACRNLASQGIRTIDYESGIHTSLEAAVRRNVMGGLGLMQEQISQENHDTLGADGWEISAHAASAPDHEDIQGKQYSDAEYTKLNASLHRRIGTLNCGHDAFPIFLGVNEPQFTAKELAEFKRQNTEGVSFEGRQYTMYEATQKQRQVERAIRSQKNRILVSEAAGDKEKLLTDQIRLRRLNEEYSRFSQATGLRTQNERAQVTGFGRGQAARAAAAAKQISVGDSQLYELDRSRRARLQESPKLVLPQARDAVIQDDKFTKYLFNPDNQRGYAKGVAFQNRLGYDINSWGELQTEIRTRAASYPVRMTGDKGHGMTYEQKMILYGKTGKPTNVVVSWIEENGIPRMTSAYIKEVKEHDD